MNDKKLKESGSPKVPHCCICLKVKAFVPVPTNADPFFVVDEADARVPHARFWGDWVFWAEDDKTISMCPACTDEQIPGWLAGIDTRTEEQRRLEAEARAEIESREANQADEVLRLVQAHREGKDPYRATKALRAAATAKQAEDDKAQVATKG